jgi:NAD-dependent deacetylase
MALTPADRDTISEIVPILRKSEDILFITGGGISADSGLPIYRGTVGLNADNFACEDVPIESALSGAMMRNNPQITWKYLLLMEKACRNAQFNRAHEIIAEMEDEFRKVWVLTQNIDGFHRDAGSKNVVDIHGDMHTVYCHRCDWREKVKDFSGFEKSQLCPRCGRFLRPDVVLFGERLPYAKYHRFEKELQHGFDIIFSIGTTSVLYYIAQPVIWAASHGIPTVEINPSRSEISHVFDFRISGGAAETLDAMWSLYGKMQGIDTKTNSM